VRNYSKSRTGLRLRNDLYCDRWGVKLLTYTYSRTGGQLRWLFESWM